MERYGMHLYLVIWSRDQQLIPAPLDSSSAVIVMATSANDSIERVSKHINNIGEVMEISTQLFANVKVIDALGKCKLLKDVCVGM